MERVLGRTLGVPLFQEQAMTLAIQCAGFTPGEADQLRRAIAAWKRKTKVIHEFGLRIIQGMTGRGYTREFAEQCFNQIKGFSEYGFPESHAASFALLVYVSAYLKKHYPAAFACALLNSQPMGFYAPAQIVRDAIRHGVEVLPIDVNHSRWDCSLEDRALRLGMRLVKGLREAEAQTLVEAVETAGRFKSLHTLWRSSGVTTGTLRHLAHADAFNSMGHDRQQALWSVLKLREEDAPLFGEVEEPDGHAPLPAVSEHRKTAQDYASAGLTLKAHPVAFLRPWLDRQGVVPASQLRDERLWPQGKWVTLAGLCLVRQRPGTASGIVFMTLEDESDTFNLIVRPHVYQRFRAVARGSHAMLVKGKVERQGQVIHVMAYDIKDISPRLQQLSIASRDFR